MSCRLILAGAVIGLLLSPVHGDTIRLTNGRSIDARGTATAASSTDDPRTKTVPEGKTRLLFSNGGYMDIPNKEIEAVEKNGKDAFSHQEEN